MHSLRLARAGLLWVVIPVLVVFFADLVWWAAHSGILWGTSRIGRLLGLALGILSLLYAARHIGDEIADLDGERAELARHSDTDL